LVKNKKLTGNKIVGNIKQLEQVKQQELIPQQQEEQIILLVKVQLLEVLKMLARI